MNPAKEKCRGTAVIGVALLLSLFAARADAIIHGIEGTSFNLTAKADHVSTPDGGSWLLWGYTNGTARAQYPGPTLIVQQGAAVTVNLTNNLSVPVSIVFPGQEGVTATQVNAPTQDGLMTREALPGGIVSYQFVASNPGTYSYYSGTNSDLQIEMGLVGVIIVRPAKGPNYAYNDDNTRFDLEYLFVLSEFDERVHQRMEFGDTAGAYQALSDRWATYWFINGRAAPDTMNAAFVSYLPTQPYNSLPLMRPGDVVLIRLVGAGHDSHPFHTHGNHHRVVALDGRLQQSSAGAGIDLSHERFTTNSYPGQTVDALFEWTGKELGWDIYGTAADGNPHTCNGQAGPSPGYDPLTKEYCPDHGKAFPVTLPQTNFLTVGAFYSGSPFMGTTGALPPGEGGLNPWGGFPYMWHSHNEKELTNNNIFPGGLLTMLIIVPPGTPLQ